MKLDIYIQGQRLDVSDKSNFSITRQVNDFSELRKRQWSYTSKFKIKKTANNRKIYSHLSFSGNTSDFTYVQVGDAQLFLNGIPIIDNGFAQIKESDDNYNLEIYDGSVFFYQAIKDLTLKDLDWSNINHMYGESSMLDSWGNTQGAVYPVMRTFESQDVSPFLDRPCPFVFIKDVVKMIESISGINLVGDIFDDDLFNRTVVSSVRSFAISPTLGSVLDSDSRMYNYTTETDVVETNVPVATGVSGYYEVRFFWSWSTTNGTLPVADIIIDGVVRDRFFMNEPSGEFITTLYGSSFSPGVKTSNFTGLQLALSLSVEIKRANYVPFSVDFSELMPSTSLGVFMKQVMVMFGLNIFPEKNENAVRLDYINDYDDDRSVDLSKYLVERTKEVYNIGSYVSKNVFKYNTKEDQDEKMNGILPYSSSEGKYNVHFTSVFSEAIIYNEEYSMYNNIMFDKAGKPTSGNMVVGVLDRIAKPIDIRAGDGKAGNVVSSYDALSINELSFSSLLPKYYHFLKNRVFNRPVMQTFNMFLPILVFLEIDFKKMMYIKAEASFYIINKMKLNSKGMSIVEGIQVERRLIEFPFPVAVVFGQKIYITENSVAVLHARDSYSPNGFVTGYFWEVFGGVGGLLFTSVKDNITFAVTDNETYQVCLSVTDDRAQQTTLCEDIESVIAPPLALDVFSDMVQITSDTCQTLNQVYVDIGSFSGELKITVNISNGQGITDIYSSDIAGERGVSIGSGNDSFVETVILPGNKYVAILQDGARDPSSPTANKMTATIEHVESQQIIVLISRQWTKDWIC